MDYCKAEEYINSIPRFTVKNPLEFTGKYLERLGNPANKAGIIHVAGTNGKGSTSSYIAGILREAGFRTGLFTSPHLLSMRERIRLGTEMIGEEEFARYTDMLCREVREAEKEGFPHPTYFEFLFLLAMLWYGDREPDYIVLETGMGGRLDATNAVPEKAVTVITRIGLDHMQYLGNTVAAIAGEKAGIIRKGVPVVTLAEPGEAFEVIREQALQKEAVCISVSGEDYKTSFYDGKVLQFRYRRGTEKLAFPLPVHALYQAENAALAVEAVRALQERIPDECIRRGLCGTQWEGRMEAVQENFFLDGAHNVDGISAFLKSAGQIPLQNGGKRFLLFSAVQDKQYDIMIRMLLDSGLFSGILIFPLRGSRALEEEKIEKVFRKENSHIYESFNSSENAMSSILKRKKKEDIVFAAGSLYLVSELKEALKNERGRKHDQF